MIAGPVDGVAGAQVPAPVQRRCRCQRAVREHPAPVATGPSGALARRLVDGVRAVRARPRPTASTETASTTSGLSMVNA